MKVYETKKIRNLALTGHAGSGKTTLAEALLFNSGAINRRGTVEEKNTVSDFYEYEQDRTCSVLATPMYAEWKDHKFNFIDTPGYDDYISETVAGIRVADVTVINLNANSMLEVGTENAWSFAEKMNKPVVFVINKMDGEQVNFENCVSELKDRFGTSLAFLQYPGNHGAGFNKINDVLRGISYEFAGQGDAKESPIEKDADYENYHGQLMEAIAETNDDLMNKYFDAGELTDDEIKGGLKDAIINRQIFPVLIASARGNIGTQTIMQFAIDYLPAPDEVMPEKSTEGNEIKLDPKAPVSLFIYKMLSEQNLGEMYFFKVMTGTLKPGLDLVNEQKNATERINQIFAVFGKKRTEVEALSAGDIGAAVKLKSSQISHTLHEKGLNVAYEPLKYPNPKVRIAIVPKTKGEEEKVGTALNAIHNEDPTVLIEHSQELRQAILQAQGDLHLGAIKYRLLNRYKVEAEYVEPRVPYRETIQKQVKGSYRHKKQSGGAGQFAEVHMLIEPWTEDLPNPAGLTVRGKEMIDLEWGGKLEYMNCIVGGVIDARFMPAILKGVMDKMQVGPLTGSYVRDIRVAIFDGKMHPVDSNEAAFKTASMNVFKDIFTQANPKLLEPIYNVYIKVPDEYMGDVMSDLPSRRGLIIGTETEGRYQIIKARMPLAELDKYAAGLRAMTQGKATYSSEYAEYQAVPPNVQQELIDAYKKQQQDEE